MITNLETGDIVSWNGDTWTVVECGYECETNADGSLGAPVTCIHNPTQGHWVVRESEVTVTAWANNPIARKGDESRPK